MIKTMITLGWAAVLLCGCGIQETSREKAGKNLSEKPIQDSRVVGRAVDIQGLVSVRGVNEIRWRPLGSRDLIAPGDWVRCDNRGPNAARIALPGGGEVILGPGTVAEWAKSTRLSLISGECEVSPGEDKPITVAGGKTPQSFSAPAIVRVSDQTLTVLKNEPSWLRGFKGVVVNESMGSLLVNVDGRDVPLTVGYHKVTVDIRDQIARTVIEESFVNHTRSRLEGVFHFPLPADASISEFGMWIGDELVRADVVEKQRAREIYETILREKRDPGLLEWSGGNMFKARVFPIFAHSEKRVTITYTQVLPMRDGVYRYTYPLQSDMLRQNPLRELQLTTTVSSTAPLKSVECASHHTRERMTKHAASLEFSAQNYTPNRDFEIEVTPKPDASPITISAHQRGNDGYFLMLLNARSGKTQIPKHPNTQENDEIPKDPKTQRNPKDINRTSNAQHSTKHQAPSTKNPEPGTRNLEPLNLVFLADTSGSMDAGQRENQALFLRAMIASLAPEDRFTLLACDVECIALTDGLVSSDSADTALDKLAARDSLGWTNLDKAFAAVLEAAPADAHVIYVGDGIQATSDIDPVETARRLKALCASNTQTPNDPKTQGMTKHPNTRKTQGNANSEKRNNGQQTTNNGQRITIHTVATGSAYEAVIMKTLASAGGGSFREMQGQRAPVTAAAELLHELTHPGLRDLSVEFNGIRTACVYPAELPNLAAGMQQVITGRYLPTSASGKGTVVVRGKLGDQPVEYTAPFTLPAIGPDFARATTGKQRTTDNGQQAADAASNSFIPRLWARRHLDVLLEQGASPEIKEQIVGFSQEFKIMTPYTSFLVLESDADRERFGVKRHFKMRDGEAFFAEGKDKANYELTRQQMLAAAQWRMNIRRKLILGLTDLGREYPAPPQATPETFYRAFSINGGLTRDNITPWSAPGWGDGVGDRLKRLEGDERFSYMDDFSGGNFDKSMDINGNELGMDFEDTDALYPAEEMDLKEISMELLATPAMDAQYAESRLVSAVSDSRSESPKKRKLSLGPSYYSGRALKSLDMAGGFIAEAQGYSTRSTFSPDMVNEYWLSQIFPAIPNSPSAEAAKLPENWSKEVTDLLTGLLRINCLNLGDQSLHMEISDTYFQASKDQAVTTGSRQLYWSPGRWLRRATDSDDITTTYWMTETELGVMDHTYWTARTRDPQPDDTFAGFPELEDGGKVFPAFVHNAKTHVTTKKTDETIELSFKQEGNDYSHTVLIIDPRRQVLLETRRYNAKGLTSKQTFGAFTNVASVWWPTKTVETDSEGVVTRTRAIRVKTVSRQMIGKAFATLAKQREQAVELPQPLPLPTEARRNIAKGEGTVADHVSVICHAVALQKWEDIREHEKNLFKQIAAAPAYPWMAISLFISSRNNQEAHRLINQLAETLAAAANNATDNALLKPARRLVSFANTAMDVNERLPLLATLKPVYEVCDAASEWRCNRIGYLQGAGRLDTALSEAASFTTDFPENVSGIKTLTSLLVSAGESDQAYAMLDEKTGTNSQLPVLSRYFLCHHWLELLRNNQSDRKAQKDVFERMFAMSEAIPGRIGTYDYRRYLDVLLSLDPEGIFKEKMNQWLDLSPTPSGDVSRPDQRAQLTAAVGMALGDGSLNYLPPEWIPELVRIVKTWAGSQTSTGIVNQIMTHHRFKQTEAAANLRGMFAEELKTELDALTVSQITQRAQWIRQSPPAVEKKDWRVIVDNLTRRWQKIQTGTGDGIEKNNTLGNTILHLSQTCLGLDEAIDFSRKRLGSAPEILKSSFRMGHFNLLTTGPWRKTYEDEAFALLDDLCQGEDPIAPATTGIHALMLLTDWMVDSRVEAGLKEEELAGKLQAMDRKSRWQLEKQLEADARLAALQSLRTHRDTLPEILRPWTGIETLTLQTRILNGKVMPNAGTEDISAPDVVAEAREALGPQAPGRFADGNELHLFRRHMALAQFWAVGGRGIDDETRESLGQFLLDYVASALDQAPREPEAGERGFAVGQADWRQVLYDLLVILNQAGPLEKHLQEWVKLEAGDSWRIPLAYLLTATDRLNAAILEMERAESAKLLSPADYRALSGWYQVVDNRAKHIAARRKALEQMPEHELSNWISRERNRTRRSDWNPADGIPPEIDIEAIVDHFIVLFRKSQSPANYIWQLNDIYRNTRDFHLLRCVPEGIVGMSAQQVYPMLNNLRQVLNEIRDEAVVDEFYAAIVNIRETAVSAVDARALLLLEAEIMRRASEVLNQPGQHTPKALAALQAAFDKGDWGPGEQLQMAQYLANLGRISQETLAAEQRRQLKILHESSEPGTLESLRICSHRAQTLSQYSQWEEAIALLEAELTAYRQANGGTFTAQMNGPMDQLVGYCESQYQFKKAEGLLLAELGRSANRHQWRWLRQRLYRTYNGSIRHKGTTSLGSGKEQYTAACGQLVAELLSEKDHNHTQNLVRIQCDIFRGARDVKIGSVAEDIVRFAMEYFPEMAVPAQQYIYQYHNMVGQLAETVKDLASPKAGIAFLLAVAEKEPPAMSYGYQSFWGQHAYRLGEWRRNVKDLGELEKPLLDLVCRELRRQVETGQQTNNSMYHNNTSYFWGEKADVFAKVAEEVLAKHPDSGKIAFQVAHYLYEGLDRYDRAIDILAEAYKKEILDENAQSYFAQCLERRSRWPEAVPVLEHLVAWRPDALGYRTRLMIAYHGAGRPADVERCRAAADTHFRQPQFWNETVAYQLGSACRHCGLGKHAVVYLEDAIALRRKARNDRVQGDHQLSNYYYELADAYSQLGNTPKAVDAASGAIVCWSRDIKQRRRSVSRLTEVLNKAKDLDAYMATVDAEADKTGLENPVLRKAAGLAYDNRAEPEKAIAQYLKALATQPNDVDTHAYYVKLLQQLSQKEALPDALLAWHRAAPRDASVIKQLYQVYTTLEQPDQAERACTMLVESQPLEAEGHQALAELRQNQDRWEETVPHWRRVVELRELEPTGLLGLAKAQIHLKQANAAQETVEKLLAKTWPERFGDVHQEARRLLK
ncbi:MAG: VIT domain-containing protein [Lentisphaeria bacterium]|nr:VIT domain-containing protein [Lentisphaeria bacterium]